MIFSELANMYTRPLSLSFSFLSFSPLFFHFFWGGGGAGYFGGEASPHPPLDESLTERV